MVAELRKKVAAAPANGIATRCTVAHPHPARVPGASLQVVADAAEADIVANASELEAAATVDMTVDALGRAGFAAAAVVS